MGTAKYYVYSWHHPVIRRSIPSRVTTPGKSPLIIQQHQFVDNGLLITAWANTIKHRINEKQKNIGSARNSEGCLFYEWNGK